MISERGELSLVFAVQVCVSPAAPVGRGRASSQPRHCFSGQLDPPSGAY